MLFKSTSLKKIIYNLLIVTLMFSCGGHGENGADQARSPVGEYQVTLIIKSWTDSSGQSNTEIATTDCDLLSTIEFKSNNTLEFINYNLNNDDDCSNTEIIVGDWMETTSVSGGFTGDFSSNSTYNGQNIFNGNYRDFDGGIALKMGFTIVIDEQSYSYKFTAIKI